MLFNLCWHYVSFVWEETCCILHLKHSPTFLALIPNLTFSATKLWNLCKEEVLYKSNFVTCALWVQVRDPSIHSDTILMKMVEFHHLGPMSPCFKRLIPIPQLLWSTVPLPITKGCSLTALLRSEAAVVPNFFLPPQQMEASMRLLSSSSHPPTVSMGHPFLYCSAWWSAVVKS